MSKILSAALVLVAVLGITQSNAIESIDKRTPIQLSSAERTLVLGEMREFLSAVQKITEGIVNEDMEKVSSYAHILGMAAAGGISKSLAAKLPVAFKKLAFDTHAKFDGIARDADDLGDEKHNLSQLSVLMNNCISCHAQYRFEIE